MGKKKLMYPGAFEELFEALQQMRSSISAEIDAINAKLIETKEPLTPLQMTEYYKLQGKSDILLTVIGIMADAIRIYETEESEEAS